MHFSFLSIIIFAVLGFTATLARIMLCAGVVGVSKYNYTNPRKEAENSKIAPETKGLIDRLNGIQANTWECLPIYIGGILSAHMAGYPAADLDFLCTVCIGLRLGFVVCYLSGNTALSFARTLCFSGHWWASMYLFYYAAMNYKAKA